MIRFDPYEIFEIAITTNCYMAQYYSGVQMADGGTV